MNINKKLKIILSIILNLIGLKKLSQRIDPNLDLYREVESSIFSNHQRKSSELTEKRNEKKVS